MYCFLQKDSRVVSLCVYFLAFACFGSFLLLFSLLQFLVSIPLEIKIKYYELVGLARLDARCLWLLHPEEKSCQRNGFVATSFPPRRRSNVSRSRRPPPGIRLLISICAAVFGGFRFGLVCRLKCCS